MPILEFMARYFRNPVDCILGQCAKYSSIDNETLSGVCGATTLWPRAPPRSSACKSRHDTGFRASPSHLCLRCLRAPLLLAEHASFLPIEVDFCFVFLFFKNAAGYCGVRMRNPQEETWKPRSNCCSCLQRWAIFNTPPTHLPRFSAPLSKAVSLSFANRWKEENQSNRQWTESCVEWSMWRIKSNISESLEKIWKIIVFTDSASCRCSNLIWKAHPWMHLHSSLWSSRTMRPLAKTSKPIAHVTTVKPCLI